MKDVTPASMSKAEAEEITTRIRSAVEDIRKLVAKAHGGKAWKALGYKSWEAYVKAEFGMSRGHSYRLLQQGEVIEAIEEAVGDLSPMGDISERTARELNDDLPAATEAIRERVEKGEQPEDAAKDIAAQRRAEKEQRKSEREAEKAENERRQQETLSQLNPETRKSIEDRDAAIAVRKAKSTDAEAQQAEPDEHPDAVRAERDELREENVALRDDVAALKAELKKLADMKVQYEQGGFEKVVADKDEQIRVLRRQVERESQEKVKNLNSMEFWKKEAIKRGYGEEDYIDIPGRVANG